MKILPVLALLLAGLSGCVDTPAADSAAPGSEPSGIEPTSSPTSAPTSNATATTTPPSATTADGPSPSWLNVTWVDVGQGSGVVLEHGTSSGTKWMLYDVGGSYPRGYQAVFDHLDARGASSLEYLVLSHSDADHARGCADAFDRYRVESFVHPGAPKDTLTWQSCLDASQGVPTLTDAELDPGDTLPFGDVDVTILHLDASKSDVNEGSIVLHVRHEDLEVLMVGEIGCSTESAIVSAWSHRPGLLDVDVVEVGHHGSKGSSCIELLGAASARYGVISVGDNGYGHPTNEAMDRVLASGATIARTDLHGDVSITSGPDGWSLAVEQAGDQDGDGVPDHEDPTPASVVREAVADAYIVQAYPDQNYGREEALHGERGADGDRQLALVKFDTAEAPPGPTCLALHSLVRNPNQPHHVSPYEVSEGWEESEVMWRTAPSLSSEPVVQQQVQATDYVLFDVSGSMNGQTVSFAMTASLDGIGGGWYFSSRESPYPPQLRFGPDCPTTGSGHAIRIEATQFDAPGNDNDNLEEEWVEICNRDTAADLTYWRLHDEADHTYTFPSFTLPADACVKVRTGHGTDSATDLYWGRNQAVWNNTATRPRS